MLCFLFIICLLFLHKIAITQFDIAEYCINDKNELGYCINILSCSFMENILQNERDNASAIEFLRKSSCGYEDNAPKVCCPLGSEISNFNNINDNKKKDEVPNKTVVIRPEKLSTYETLSYSKLPTPKSCGRKNSIPSFRIIGGRPADLGSWPWIVAIGYISIYAQNNPPQWLCGGTLISDRYVVTAAHCTIGLGYKKISVVRIGELDFNPDTNDGASPIDVFVERVMTHEEFNWQNKTNDIAILKLNNSISFNNFIQPICLPIMPDLRVNQFVKYIAKVAGWGSTAYHGSLSTMLMEAFIPVINNSECYRSYADKNVVLDERILCTGYKTGGIDTCYGDSGGPMVLEIEEQSYLIGVLSFGLKCGEPNFPVVYSRLTYFVDWIVEKINSSEDSDHI
ncbi:venom protease-like [Daktulosphaira vitifoliae]|uniref:venom protease-like n=1 Tax=Daktulosphaira vitifoliae TaxID=58002 RepID=UPI0021A98BA3|nr:venom protease-like [Daktulosphaira vitifoliae]